MSRRIDLPGEAHVRAVLADMLAEAAAGGARPSVIALARRLGLSNATFWRHFRDIATDVRHAANAAMAPASAGNLRPDLREEHADQNARLRRENARLVDQLEAALGHLRRLTIDNLKLRHDLEAARAITHLDPGRKRSQRT
jgi:AcrR family transcriptional regulator